MSNQPLPIERVISTYQKRDRKEERRERGERRGERGEDLVQRYYIPIVLVGTAFSFRREGAVRPFEV